MKRTALLIAMLIVVGCSAHPETKAKFLAEQVIKSNLKDPDSAKFSELYVVPYTGKNSTEAMMTVCGYVNAKNSFGGYTGNKRFAVLISAPKEYAAELIYHWIEGADKSAASGKNQSKHKETAFEKLAWNPHCTDSLHPKTYSGE